MTHPVEKPLPAAVPGNVCPGSDVPPPAGGGWVRAGLRLAVRLGGILLGGAALLWVVHQASLRLERDPRPAGFGRGMMHGALMPMAMPNLLLGEDVIIYAPQNQGRSYKLGYTVGVNVCGLLFFSLGLWRVQRLRRDLRG